MTRRDVLHFSEMKKSSAICVVDSITIVSSQIALPISFVVFSSFTSFTNQSVYSLKKQKLRQKRLGRLLMSMPLPVSDKAPAKRDTDINTDANHSMHKQSSGNAMFCRYLDLRFVNKEKV
jgi:hypothetical protein